ncbi:hypothetical protein GCM10018962_93950 [Dactylosporangium matsuzakiense]|uniref:Uncharacterized protein n=1 Tax=Dactylosporangium matsuzakiense TaxID=53360 RepID=A0A9W6NRF1_9ACTN|nr:hypothetical protein GCM10017581_079690 [Dactylosporangium matsuzakiense]
MSRPSAGPVPHPSAELTSLVRVRVRAIAIAELAVRPSAGATRPSAGATLRTGARSPRYNGIRPAPHMSLHPLPHMRVCPVPHTSVRLETPGSAHHKPRGRR